MAYKKTNIGDSGQKLVDNLDNNFAELYTRSSASVSGREFPTSYRANLSMPGSQVVIPLSLSDSSEAEIYLRYKYSTAAEISISIRSAHTNSLVDVKRSTQWDALYVEGSSIDNTLITSTYQTIDLIVYNQSNEMHKIWVRFKDHLDNNFWAIYEINCFCSANAARTDIWIVPIYQGHIGDWQ